MFCLELNTDNDDQIVYVLRRGDPLPCREWPANGALWSGLLPPIHVLVWTPFTCFGFGLKTDFHHPHSCDNGKLAPPVPSIDSTFLVIALQSPYFESAFIQASGLGFRIGGGAPATYCPDQVAQLGACPAGTETVWTCSAGYCGLVHHSKSVHLAIANDCRPSRCPGASKSTSAPTAPSAIPKPTPPMLHLDPNFPDSR